MPLHLKKLSVGSTSIDSLRAWHEEVLSKRRQIVHVTRSFPRRAAEIISADGQDNGSIYWVIKGRICARQVVDDMVEVEREDGGKSCGIVLRPGLIPVFEKRHRPFQGWRYLDAKDAPADIPSGINQEEEAMPAEMAEELHDLGLL
jgi:hypothetical protein